MLSKNKQAEQLVAKVTIDEAAANSSMHNDANNTEQQQFMQSKSL